MRERARVELSDRTRRRARKIPGPILNFALPPPPRRNGSFYQRARLIELFLPGSLLLYADAAVVAGLSD